MKFLSGIITSVFALIEILGITYAALSQEQATAFLEGSITSLYVVEPCTLLGKITDYETDHEDFSWNCAFDVAGNRQIILPIEGIDISKDTYDDDGQQILSGHHTISTFLMQIINEGNDPYVKIPSDSRPIIQNGQPGGQNRKLADTVGDKDILVVRVIGADLATTASAADLSDSVFGTNSDSVNIASQYAACSYDKLRILPGTQPPGVSLAVTDGVVEVTISKTIIGASNSVIENAVLNELITQGFSLPGDFDHIMLCLPPGTTRSWIAYAYLDYWLSVYNNEWCTRVSTQMHEIGHNLNLHHSGQGANEYNDQSGMMGYSYASDDTPVMCFNGPKSWQLGWYEDRHTTVEPLSACWTGDLVGLADYENSVDETVVLKINTSTEMDYYVNFNRQTGINSGTREGGNQVMITTQGGEGSGASRSKLQKTLNIGESYLINDFDDSAQTVIITVDSILTPTTYTVATVTVVLSGETCFASERTYTPTDIPTSSTTTILTATPTASPTSIPISGPTKYPTSEPTSNPTAFPTTPPTAIPTLGPTQDPTSGPTSGPTTSMPTAGPTSIPTSRPTSIPTSTPIQNPTIAPTSEPTPTSSPTNNPTSTPTATPTSIPTSGPTQNPTPEPTSGATTSTPTLGSTSTPTLGPTPMPTLRSTSPTSRPTSGPTIPIPTSGPTSIPTLGPTSPPTPGPTWIPTSGPTSIPTSGPKSTPTSSPTQNPTSGPAITPMPTTSTQSPTQNPTTAPTLGPSLSLNSEPTLSPTSEPTSKPTSGPTVIRTSSPTSGPTSLSTSIPTSGPTFSASPTTLPTSGSTSSPTSSPTSGPEICTDVDGKVRFFTTLFRRKSRWCFQFDRRTCRRILVNGGRVFEVCQETCSRFPQVTSRPDWVGCVEEQTQSLNSEPIATPNTSLVSTIFPSIVPASNSTICTDLEISVNYIHWNDKYKNKRCFRMDKHSCQRPLSDGGFVFEVCQATCSQYDQVTSRDDWIECIFGGARQVF